MNKYDKVETETLKQIISTLEQCMFKHFHPNTSLMVTTLADAHRHKMKAAKDNI